MFKNSKHGRKDKHFVQIHESFAITQNSSICYACNVFVFDAETVMFLIVDIKSFPDI